jgi:hypothetical protein
MKRVVTEVYFDKTLHTFEKNHTFFDPFHKNFISPKGRWSCLMFHYNAGYEVPRAKKNIHMAIIAGTYISRQMLYAGLI